VVGGADGRWGGTPEYVLLADGADSYEFHVESATHDFALNDFSSVKTIWRLALVNDEAHEVLDAAADGIAVIPITRPRAPNAINKARQTQKRDVLRGVAQGRVAERHEGRRAEAGVGGRVRPGAVGGDRGTAGPRQDGTACDGTRARHVACSRHTQSDDPYRNCHPVAPSVDIGIDSPVSTRAQDLQRSRLAGARHADAQDHRHVTRTGEITCI